MKDNKEFIKGIYDKYDEYLKDQNTEKFKQVKTEKTKKSFWNSGVVRTLSAAAVLTIVVSGAIVTNNLINNNEETTKIGQTTTSNKLSLKTIGNFENFCNIVVENSKNYRRLYDIEDGLVYEDADTAVKSATAGDTTSQSETSSQTTNSDYSRTNTQVENVDEADMVKTDGKYIYYVANNKVYIVDIKDKTAIKGTAKIDYENDEFKPSEIYIYKDKLIVLGNARGYSKGEKVRETSNSIYKRGVYKQKTVAVVYDLTNVNSPKEVRRVEIEGNYVSSRMINDDIYFISNKNLSVGRWVENPLDIDENDYKPTYRDTLNGTTEKRIDFNEIYYFNNIETLNYLTLGGFSLDGKNEATVKTFLGSGEDVYCSENNMYIAKAKNVYDYDNYMSYGEDTKILKFELNDGDIKFKAEATIEGGINNQFSMDEKDGYFRIATTIGRTYNMDQSTSNCLYILDKDLKEVGRLDGIAKGEKIYSVRYVGNKAYMVTFKEIDPLFVIDLSDVRNPRILGELKIPGYSTYLHPYDETHIIGFGYDTKASGFGDGVRNDGLKMAMFDVSDLSNPKEMFNIKIGDSRASSPLANNHKALLFSKEKNFIAFPVTYYPSQTSKYTERKYTARIYDIDLNKGFTVRGEIEHKVEDVNLTIPNTLEKSTYTSSYYSRSTKLNIDRILYSDDVFYTVSKGLVKSSDMETVQELSKLNLN